MLQIAHRKTEYFFNCPTVSLSLTTFARNNSLRFTDTAFVLETAAAAAAAAAVVVVVVVVGATTERQECRVQHEQLPLLLSSNVTEIFV
jgi:hypothetical protein